MDRGRLRKERRDSTQNRGYAACLFYLFPGACRVGGGEMSRSTRRKPPLSEPAPPLSPLPPPTQPPTGWMRLALPCLILHYLVFACLHACYVPTGQTGYQNAPDEAAHVTYIRVLATGRLPTRDHPETGLQPTAP